MNRRASLPGADELFGLGNRQPETDEETANEAGDVSSRALAAARRLFAPEDDTLVAARDRAGATLDLPRPEVGALLRWTVKTCDARTAVEVGSAGGVSGLWLLGALPERGVLTSIEPDPDAHALAGETFRSANPGPRLRSIRGDSTTVLPRLSDGSYDLVLLQANPADYPQELAHARRLLRPGGVLVARGVLRSGEYAGALNRFLEELADDSRFSSIVLPVDDGLVMATRLLAMPNS